MENIFPTGEMIDRDHHLHSSHGTRRHDSTNTTTTAASLSLSQYLHHLEKYSAYFHDKQRSIRCQYETIHRFVDPNNHGWKKKKHPHSSHSSGYNMSDTERQQFTTSYLLPVNCTVISQVLRPSSRISFEKDTTPSSKSLEEVAKNLPDNYDHSMNDSSSSLLAMLMNLTSTSSSSEVMLRNHSRVSGDPDLNEFFRRDNSVGMGRLKRKKYLRVQDPMGGGITAESRDREGDNH